MNRQALTASVMRAATDPALAERAFAERARRIGRAVADEDGGDAACTVIEEWATAKGIVATTG